MTKNEQNQFIIKAKRLLEWNKEKLTCRSNLKIEDLKELFAPEFVVLANGRKYDANYQNYVVFLNQFRSESTVIMPLQANIKRLHGKVDIFDAILILKFDNAGKIVHWQEVYSVR